MIEENILTLERPTLKWREGLKILDINFDTINYLLKKNSFFSQYTEILIICKGCILIILHPQLGFLFQEVQE